MRSGGDLRLHHPRPSARGMPTLSHRNIQPASLQRIRAIEWVSAASGSFTERLRPLRNAAACRKSTRSSAPGPGGIGGHASWLLGPRSRSDACGFELAPGGVRDGNYAHFPAPAPELSPAPGPRTLVLLASRVLGPGSAHLSRPRMKPAAG